MEVVTALRPATEKPQDMDCIKGHPLAIEQVGHDCNDSQATVPYWRVMEEDSIDNPETERPRKRWRRDSLTFEMIACSEVSCDFYHILRRS